ncbi:hypothetical protein BDY24DRAFT_378961 [Mrakia frigida]|uniref:uncharacterized protein n=1 Tax=Mrakia frigida TaxID=29902 RepID=UPI003FCBF995
MAPPPSATNLKRKAPAAPSPTPTDQSQPSSSTNPSKRKRPRTSSKAAKATAALAPPLLPPSSASLPPRPPAPTPVASTSKLPPPPPPPAVSNAPPPRVNRKRKLVPPRPLDSLLPPGSAVTGPTAQIEGRTVVLVSRKSSLSSYMRRCKALIVEEGCSSLTLHGLTASIPHTLLLLHSLLSILPFPANQVSYTIKTTSVRVTDEIVPEDEEEEIEMMGRWCSGVEIVVLIGGGVGKEAKGVKGKKAKEKKQKAKGAKKSLGTTRGVKGKGKAAGEGGRAGAGMVEDEGADEDLGEVFVEEDEMDAMNG